MYLWIANGHPSVEKKDWQPRRKPVPPVQPHRDRKKDYERKPKHVKKEAV